MNNEINTPSVNTVARVEAKQLASDNSKDRYPFLHKYTSLVKKAERAIVGRQNEMNQIMAAFMRPELCNIILLGDAGSGKALANDTVIPVADKRCYVPIQNLVVGDKVYDENGEVCDVLGVYPQGELDAYLIKFTDGSSLVCNDEHLWTVTDTKTDEELTLTARELIDNGIKHRGNLRYRIMANGYCDDHGIELKELVKALIKVSDLPYCEKDINDFEQDFGPLKSSYFKNLSIHQKFEYLLLISNNYMYSEYWDSDYCLVLDDIELANDVKCLFSSVGLRVSVEKFEKKINKKKVTLFGFKTVDDLFIESIEYLRYKTEMTCIYVSSESHLFQAGYDHIVTHNTMLVQGVMTKDTSRIYLEVDLSKMIANLNDPNEMAANLKQLFDETALYSKNESKELVLFIDEFHQIVQLSAAAVEALKPLLADSGTRGIRVIAATTYREFKEFISPNQPLVERLQRISLKQPDKDMTVQILRGMARRYGVESHFPTDSVFEAIYEYTNRYNPANSQPRKSILILDNMVGWHRLTGKPMDKQLLSDIFAYEGINTSFSIDANSVKQTLDKHVLSQGYASEVISKRLHICVADLNDKSRPMASFLFTGSTGVGKLVSNLTPVPIYSKDGKGPFWKNHGDLVKGDVIFARDGSPTTVTDTFKHKNVAMYDVILTDGRRLTVGDNHLWTVYTAEQRSKKDKGIDVKPMVLSTKEIIDKGVVRTYEGDSRRHLKWFIPMNEAVCWTEKNYSVDPYVIGAFIGNGCNTLRQLGLLSDDEETVALVAEKIGAIGYYQRKSAYTWHFELPYEMRRDSRHKSFTTQEFFKDYPEMINCYAREKKIPEEYMTGSIEQRWELVRGLFDIDGTVSDDDRCRVHFSTTSKTLAYDVQSLLYSLGISSTVTRYERPEKIRKSTDEIFDEYRVSVKCSMEDKLKFFHLTRKLDIIRKWMESDKRTRVKKFDLVGISDIVYVGEDDAQCIMVDNEEHLYQAGDFVVTHNTEMTKQLAKILFNDDRNLIRFDMSEFANSDSLDRFRTELTESVWARPYSIVLLDEIEKACGEVTRLLLQVLDDGRLLDANSREVTFTNAYMVLTTNAGSEIYNTMGNYATSSNKEPVNSYAAAFLDGQKKENDVKDLSEDEMADIIADYDKAIRRSLTSTTAGNRFPPELLGRIDAIVPFMPLSDTTMINIVRMKLEKLRNTLFEKHDVKLLVDNRVIDYLVFNKLDTDSDSGGARIVMRKLESDVIVPIAKFINRYPSIKNLMVSIDGILASENKALLKSSAKVVVKPYVYKR